MHIHTPQCKGGLRRAKVWRLCAIGVRSWCKIPPTISNWIRDGRAMFGGVSRYSTAAGPSGGQKSNGETSTGEFGTGSTVNHSSRRVRDLVERCCSCTRHSTCSTTARPLEVVNATTLAGSALGATAGVSVKIRGGLCRPQQLREAYRGFSHRAWTRPPTTHAQQPCLSDRQHLRPYGQYWCPGPGAGARGEGRAAAGARGRRGGEEREREAGTVTLGEGSAAQHTQDGGRPQRNGQQCSWGAVTGSTKTR